MDSGVRDYFDIEADECSSISEPSGSDGEDSSESSSCCIRESVDARVHESDDVDDRPSQARRGNDGNRIPVDGVSGVRAVQDDRSVRASGAQRRGRPGGAANRPLHERGERSPRFRGTTFLLTAPQSGDVGVSAALGHLSGLHDFEWACAVVEHHSDGSPHIHVAIRYDGDGLDFTSPGYFDHDGLHYNIRVVKKRRGDVERVLKYIGKEHQSGRPDAMRPVVKHVSKELTYEELLVMFTKAQGTAQVVANMIRNGSSTDDILRNESTAGWMLMNLNRVATYRTAMVQASQHERLQPWDLTGLRAYRCRTPRAQHCWNVILSWLDGMIRKPLPHRPRQLWIVGPPGAGKSLLVRHLSKMLRVYSFPKDTKFHDLWEHPDLIVADDVMIPIYDFLSWADGTTMTIEKKGGTTRKEGPYPFLMLSNNHPRAMYTQCKQVTLDALAGTEASRFFVLEWPEEAPLPVPDFTGVTRWEPPADDVRAIAAPSTVIDPYTRSGVNYERDYHREPSYSYSRRDFPGRN